MDAFWATAAYLLIGALFVECAARGRVRLGLLAALLLLIGWWIVLAAAAIKIWRLR